MIIAHRSEMLKINFLDMTAKCVCGGGEGSTTCPETWTNK